MVYCTGSVITIGSFSYISRLLLRFPLPHWDDALERLLPVSQLQLRVNDV